MQRQAKDLLALGCGAVLLKGGHMTGEQAIDILVTRQSPESSSQFAAPRVDTPNTHGTGCTLAAAIAANLALGQPLPEAVGSAKQFLAQALEAGRHLRVGQGSGPVDHMFAFRRR
jgi:hydroxymethylpyrimidine/phosphomethylpyrimidine kinase